MISILDTIIEEKNLYFNAEKEYTPLIHCWEFCRWKMIQKDEKLWLKWFHESDKFANKFKKLSPEEKEIVKTIYICSNAEKVIFKDNAKNQFANQMMDLIKSNKLPIGTSTCSIDKKTKYLIDYKFITKNI